MIGQRRAFLWTSGAFQGLSFSLACMVRGTPYRELASPQNLVLHTKYVSVIEDATSLLFELEKDRGKSKGIGVRVRTLYEGKLDDEFPTERALRRAGVRSFFLRF